MTNEIKAKVISASLDKSFCDGFVSSGLSVFNSPKYTVFPGFCDVHVHFREPGFSYKETMETGSYASARGGYTAVCTMPNLNPVPDTVEHLALQKKLIEENACIHVYPLGAILTILLAEFIAPLLPYMLSFAAGAMLYVVVEELIPEMSEGEHSNIGTIFFAVGFTLMMMLDVALG